MKLTAKQEQRFYSKINKTDTCWLWLGTKGKSGYGAFWLNTKPVRAHRLSYVLKYGSFDQSLYVCHHCDNPSCVNPEHLFLGTNKDNMDDGYKKGRIKWVVAELKKAVTHCPYGHMYGASRIRNRKGKLTNERVCIECHRRISIAYNRRVRAKNNESKTT